MARAIVQNDAMIDRTNLVLYIVGLALALLIGSQLPGPAWVAALGFAVVWVVLVHRWRPS